MQKPTQGAAFPASGTHQAGLNTGLAWGEWKDLGGIHWLQSQSFSFVTQEAKAQLKVSPSHCVSAKTYGSPCRACISAARAITMVSLLVGR
uniref:Uncharacterized protein n=1 Tax=Piliocolobus tephrosceles TaxID=591936 RepID=A0A8C9GEI6_9PRIM